MAALVFFSLGGLQLRQHLTETVVKWEEGDERGDAMCDKEHVHLCVHECM